MASARDVHLNGSIPLADAAEVFRLVGGILGDKVRRVPDGETGERSHWIQWQHPLFTGHPDLEPAEGAEYRYGGRTLLRLRPGAEAARFAFGPLGYAAAAKRSFADFRAAREAGEMPDGCRFLVCLPTPLAPVAGFVVPEAQPVVEPAYEKRLLAEVDEMLAAIPHRDLAIQWDVARELMLVEGIVKPAFGDVLGGIAERLARLAARVPDDVELGFHLCYGDFGHKHFVEPKDTANLVKVANAVSAAVGRPIEFLHMPVPRSRDDEAYFAPLAGLRLHPETRLYLGLVHMTDGLEGTRRRMAAAGRFVEAFGIATECGMGRRPAETIPELLRIHARAAEAG